MQVGSLDIEIRRSARKKTITVNIEPDGSVNAMVPQDCSDDVIFKELSAREYNICQHVAKRKAVTRAQINRSFVNGQAFLFMGESYNLQIVNSVETLRATPLQIIDDRFVLNAKHLPTAREQFIKFYKKQGLPYLQERVSHFSKLVGREPTNISVRELGAHWASCTPKKNVNFHWKCLMAKPEIIDYLVVHELTHLKYPQHSRQFWDAVFSVMPNYKECEDWLHDYGVTLNL